MTDGETGSPVAGPPTANPTAPAGTRRAGGAQRRRRAGAPTAGSPVLAPDPAVPPVLAPAPMGSGRLGYAQAVAFVRSDDFTRVFRYGTVSAFNVVGHQSLLFLANSPSVGNMGGGSANALAATIMCIPAYLLSRNWVWRVDGAPSVKFQVLPFWVITLVGLLVSTIMAAVAQATFGAGLVVNLAAFLGYFLVWIGKFLVLERLFGRFTAT